MTLAEASRDGGRFRRPSTPGWINIQLIGKLSQEDMAADDWINEEEYMKIVGTPGTLDHAIGQFITLAGPSLKEQGYQIFRDFLAQKFTVAYGKASENAPALEYLHELFHECTKRS